MTSALERFHRCTQEWFADSFAAPTRVQTEAWPQIAAGKNTLLLAPTGSGKTLAAFLAAIDRMMFRSTDSSNVNGYFATNKVRLLYISPIKALGVDVDRNLRTPLAGLSAAAEQRGAEFYLPTVGVRSGDTSTAARRKMTRQPPDILITTPESLYLLLTSQAATILDAVETLIVDEIHALAGTKRGSHLFLSLERLERLRKQAVKDVAPLQRIGLSATQRPLSEIANLLGGAIADADPDNTPAPRSVEIIDGSEPKQFVLNVETPAEDMAALAQREIEVSRVSKTRQPIPSIWPSIHPRLVELIRAHRSTMIFVNNRRLAERLTNAINELAEEEIARAHHGSIARDVRADIEGRLKRGELPAMIATSSMELGIDMGAVDLVIQIEAPPSIASGTQRIGRAGHQVGAPSHGVIFPKFRGDLLACAAATGAMLQGWVEETRYPRNPLDVLAQQIVAMTSREVMTVDEVFATVRSAAPFAELPRSAFEGVLDLLSGRYPSEEFSELKPRITWDRIAGTLSPRQGAQRLAIMNAGTIPDRGLYGVFLVGDGPNGSGGSRVGELDEEMVFETKPGEVFLLGASSWRVLDITRDRVLVAPAPGEPGRMPFWRGDGPGRPLEFGRAIGALSRELVELSPGRARTKLLKHHGLDDVATNNLLTYLHDQTAATGELPSDRTIVIESFADEIGDWRIVILTPFGRRVHAPWAMIVGAKVREHVVGEIDLTWTDDGIVFRVPESGKIPPQELFFPDPEDVEDAIVQQVGSTALFAGRFRENAARAMLLPRRYPGRRTPLWLQRRRAADLLNVAARFRDFPILLETYRECMSDVFDVDGLVEILRGVRDRSIVVHRVESEKPSPFSNAVLFGYAGNFLYDGDAPLAERRAQALALDQSQLRELLGSANFRELIDPQAVEQLHAELQRLTWKLQHADDLHDVLLKLGPLTIPDLRQRVSVEVFENGTLQQWLNDLCNSRRLIEVTITSDVRYAAAEDAGRLRDALGIDLPQGLPDAFLQPADDPLAEIVSRYARTHCPFTTHAVASHFGLGVSIVERVLRELVARGRVVEGEFLPDGSETEWCESSVLKQLKRRSLAALRRKVESVDPVVLSRFLPEWQAVTRPRKGLDGLLDTIEQIQGIPLPASTLENEILPARVEKYRPRDLDELCLAGEVIWRGFASAGSHDGQVSLFLTEHYPLLATPVDAVELVDDPLIMQIRELLNERGALLFSQIKQATSAFPPELLETLWMLVWAGELTNDTLAPLRSLHARGVAKTSSAGRSHSRRNRAFRSRRATVLPGSEGRWSLLPRIDAPLAPTVTQRQAAIAAQLVERYGVLTKEMLARERVVGGFAGLYPVLKAMEESGRVRRGYFVSGLGAAQFAAPGAEDRLRAVRDKRPDKSASKDSSQPSAVTLAATDPANIFGTVIPWPKTSAKARPQRVPGARVFLLDGQLLGYLNRSHNQLSTFGEELNADGQLNRQQVAALAQAIAQSARPGSSLLLEKLTARLLKNRPSHRSCATPDLFRLREAICTKAIARRTNVR